VLVVEDSKDDALLLVRELRRCGYEPEHERVETPEAMKEALGRCAWDVILSDYRMPHFRAPEALVMARETGSEAPFVVVSGKIGEDAAVEVMRAGAYDYVMKDNLARLCATVARGLEEAEERRERRRIEEALRGSQERYRAVIEQATDGIYLLDAGTRSILETNPSFQRMLGYAADELLGMEVYDFVAHTRENIDAVIGRTLKQKRRLVGGRRYRRKDGSHIDVEVGVSVISVGDKEVICTIVRDVTERTRSEEALKRSEARHRAVVDTAFDAVITMSADGIIRSFNRAAERMFGYVMEEAVGQQLELLMPERFRKSHAAGLRRYLRTGDARVVGQRRLELAGRRNGGEEFPLELSISETHEEGNVLFIGIVRDITERKRAEEALRQSERLWRTVIEQATENIFLLETGTGRIVESNPAFREAIGYAEEELKRMTIYDIVAHDRESIDVNLQRVLGEGRYPVGERRYRRKDGSLLEEEVSASTILRGDRQVFCVGAHDVTERARTHRLLEERVASLSRIAANLTFDLPTEDELDATAENVVSASTAVACGVVLLDERADTPHLFGSYGLPEGYTAGLQDAYRSGAPSPSLRAFRTRRPVLVRDFRRQLLSEPLYSPIHRFVHEVAWDVVYSVPLISRGRALGAIFFCYPPEGEPDDDEKVFLGAVADQAAVAVENARLFAEASGKAALVERQRLARELHDSVSQALYGIALGVRTASDDLLDGDPERAAEPLNYVMSLAQAGLAEMRALIFELRPESLEQEGLVPALEMQAAALRARHEIEVETFLCDEPDASIETKETLYRIAQEALHNTVKHARAESVLMKLRCDSERITLEISDDSVGFDPEEDFPGHLGLRSMRERTLRLRGTLALETVRGKGTRIRAQIPL